MNAAELLFDLGRLGIRLQADGDKLRYHPRSALTPDLADRLKAQKAELMALLRPAGEAPQALPVAAIYAPAKPACRCGSTTWRDVAIHDGLSIRRDCRGCGRFIDFPLWYGANTLLNE